MPQEPLKSMKKSIGRDTLMVASKSDPRLRAYQDSLRLYKNNPNQNDLNYLLKEGTYIKTKGTIPGVKNQPIAMYSPDFKKMEEYDKAGKSYSYISPTDERAKQKGYKKINGEYFNKDGARMVVATGVYKKPVQPVKYQKPKDKPTEIVKKDISSTPLSLMKKPLEKNNYDEGESVMLRQPDSLGGGGGAFIGTKKKDGTIEYVKPEDFKRMGVPPYGQEFILNKLSKKE
jgi:hypothetical protein